jgi:hypothetical protein
MYDKLVSLFPSLFLSLLTLSPSCLSVCQDGEKKGVSPEEVYTGMRVSGVGNILPCDWLKAELPHLLDQICATATSSRAADLKAGQNQNGTGTSEDTGVEEEQTRGGGVTLSRAEAKLAWLSAGGDTERAVKQALRDRHSKVRDWSESLLPTKNWSKVSCTVTFVHFADSYVLVS